MYCGKLGLTHLMEYEIHLIENTKVRLPPYMLSPPRMQYLREHIKTLLRDGVIETHCVTIRAPCSWCKNQEVPIVQL